MTVNKEPESYKFELVLANGRSFKTDDSNALYDWAQKQNPKWAFELKAPRPKKTRKRKKTGNEDSN